MESEIWVLSYSHRKAAWELATMAPHEPGEGAVLFLGPSVPGKGATPDVSVYVGGCIGDTNM